MGQSLPPVAVLVIHRIGDYDSWKRVFDDHQSARRKASCLGHDVNRGADDPDMLYVYCPATDADKLSAFVDNPELKGTMKEAGVQGAPSVRMMTPTAADFIPDEKLPGLIVIHRVENYDAWRKVYDHFDGYRKEHGIVGHAVNQELGNPNQVIVYHQARELATLRAFVDSPELKEAMQRGGVSGPPEIHFIECVDIAEY